MKKNFLLALMVAMLMLSCNKDKALIDNINAHNVEMETKGYHFGDEIKLPQEILEHISSVSVGFGDRETSDLVITPEYYTLGDNAVVLNIKTKEGVQLSIDAVINVLAKTPEQSLSYEILQEYPHNSENFVQGFQLEGSTIYGSNGQNGKSKVLKYTLGATQNIAETALDYEYFGEGSTLVGDKLYQLTWKHGKGFIYDKATLKNIGEFTYPSRITEGWGLAYDGKDLILSDGTRNIYFLSLENPQNVSRVIAVAGNTAGNTEFHDQINELEYHQGFIYANVWQRPYILKINPKNGEVVGKIDFSEIYQKHTKGGDDVLNGIAFKGDNMLITGKNWDKIYEIRIK